MFLWVYLFIITKFKITTNFTNFFTDHNFHVFRLTYWNKLIDIPCNRSPPCNVPPNELPGTRFRESLLGHMFCPIIAYTVDRGTNLMPIPRASLGLMYVFMFYIFLMRLVLLLHLMLVPRIIGVPKTLQGIVTTMHIFNYICYK